MGKSSDGKPITPHRGSWAAQLEEERHQLMNSFGDGLFKDGLKRQRIAEIDALLDTQIPSAGPA